MPHQYLKHLNTVLLCFDTVVWVTGRASSISNLQRSHIQPQKVEKAMLQTHKLSSHTFSLFPILTLNNKHSHTRFNGHYFRRTLVSWFHIVKPFWILWQQETTQKVMLKTRTLKPAKLQSNHHHHHHHHHHQTHTKVFHRPDALPLSPNQQCQCNEDVQTNPDDSN